MRWRVLDGIGKIPACFLAGVVIAAGLSVPAAAQSTVRPTQPRSSAPVRIKGQQRHIPRPKDPETAAILINLIARYANNVSDKNELDKRLEQALSADPGSRNAARRLVANVQRAPLAERQIVFGRWADTSTTARFSPADAQRAFARIANLRAKVTSEQELPRAAPSGALKHKRFENPNDEREQSQPGLDERRPFRDWIPRDRNWIPGPGAEQRFYFPSILPVAYAAQAQADRYQLYYNGMWCHYETDDDHGTDSDEIYAIVTITEASGASSTLRIPSRHDPPYYWDVDTGEHRPKSGNIRLIWGGSQGRTARPLSVAVWVWEQDSGDPEERKQAVDLAWKAALTICGATIENSVFPCVFAVLGAAAIEAIVAIVSGGDDDLVGEGPITTDVSAARIRNWVNGGLRTFRRGDIPCHFRTIHNGTGNSEGADYHMYFAFHPAEPIS